MLGRPGGESPVPGCCRRDHDSAAHRDLLPARRGIAGPRRTGARQTQSRADAGKRRDSAKSSSFAITPVVGRQIRNIGSLRLAAIARMLGWLRPPARYCSRP